MEVLKILGAVLGTLVASPFIIIGFVKVLEKQEFRSFYTFVLICIGLVVVFVKGLDFIDLWITNDYIAIPLRLFYMIFVIMSASVLGDIAKEE
ncbi:MAG: hypothetical protein QW735_04355 [archaeon]